jgi:hypothetical protein
MIARSDMRNIIRAAKQRWETPAEHRPRCVKDVQEVLDGDVPDYLKETANEAMAALKANGWTDT